MSSNYSSFQSLTWQRMRWNIWNSFDFFFSTWQRMRQDSIQLGPGDTPCMHNPLLYNVPFRLSIEKYLYPTNIWESKREKEKRKSIVPTLIPSHWFRREKVRDNLILPWTWVFVLLWIYFFFSEWLININTVGPLSLLLVAYGFSFHDKAVLCKSSVSSLH